MVTSSCDPRSALRCSEVQTSVAAMPVPVTNRMLHGTWRLPKPNSFFKSYWCWENMRKRHNCMQVDGFQAILFFFRPVFGRFKSCLCLHVQGTRNKQSHAIATWGCLLKYPHVNNFPLELPQGFAHLIRSLAWLWSACFFFTCVTLPGWKVKRLCQKSAARTLMWDLYRSVRCEFWSSSKSSEENLELQRIPWTETNPGLTGLKAPLHNWRPLRWRPRT